MHDKNIRTDTLYLLVHDIKTKQQSEEINLYFHTANSVKGEWQILLRNVHF